MSWPTTRPAPNAASTQQTAGARISAVATSDLWAETGIQTGQPHRQDGHGDRPVQAGRDPGRRQSRNARHPFFFDGDGDPVYLGLGLQGHRPLQRGAGNVRTRRRTAGELPCDIEIVYDDELFNEVTVGHEAAAGRKRSTPLLTLWRKVAAAPPRPQRNRVDPHRAHGRDAVAAAILEAFHSRKVRVASLTVNGSHTAARPHPRTADR